MFIHKLFKVIKPKDHIYHKCPDPCPLQHTGLTCQYCDGGLAFCTVCKKGEADLEPTCPGPPKEREVF